MKSQSIFAVTLCYCRRAILIGATLTALTTAMDTNSQSTNVDTHRHDRTPPLAPGLVEKAIAAARSASTNAYCPYSKFRVGAAVVTENDEIFAGCNVENASYGLTICAERNAVFQAVAKGRKEIKLVVVYTPTTIATAPCGACRQVINEFGPTAGILCICDAQDQIKESLDDLLKKAFGPRNLK